MPTTRGPAFIFSNVVAKSYAAVSVLTPYTSAAPSTMGPEWLKTEEPTEKARIVSLDPLATRWRVQFTKGTDREIGGMALVGAPLSPWGSYRFTSDPLTYEDLAPSSIATSSNTTGIVGDIDEIAFTPDANYMVPTTATSAWSVRTVHATPAASPVVGSRGFIVVYAALVGTPSTSYPTVNASLYQSGTLLANLGFRAVTSATGQLFVFPFDTAVLTDPSGANMRANLEFTADTDVSVKLGLVRIYVETGAPTEDSGWIDSPSVLFGDEDDGPSPTTNLAYWPPVPWVGVDDLYVQVVDDQVEHDPDLNGGLLAPIGNIDNVYLSGAVDAGVLVVGEATVLDDPGILMDGTPAGNVVVEQFGGTTVGGQTYGADAFRRRTVNVELTVTRDQLLVLQTRLAWLRGHVGAFYFAAEPDIPVDKQLFNSGWFTLDSMSDPTRLAGQAYDAGAGDMLFVVTLVMSEKL
jgi:hypothetical protein